MRKLIAILAMITISISVMAAKYVEVRPVAPFYMIENNTRIPIHYYHSNVNRVEVVGYKNDVARVGTRVVAGRLYIEDFGVMRSMPIINVYCSRLDQYDGTGDFIAKTAMTLLNAIFNLSGPARLDIGRVDAKQFTINARGTGRVNVRDAHVEGPHNINNFGTGKVMFNGRTHETIVMNHDQGNVRGKVQTQQFNGTNMGRGNINMRGQAQKVVTEKRGQGKSEFKRR